MEYTLTFTKVIDDKDHNISKLIGNNPLTEELKLDIFEDLLDSNEFFTNIKIDLSPTMNDLQTINSAIIAKQRLKIVEMNSEINECYNLIDLYVSKIRELESLIPRNN